jgi:hypothetical protein
VSTREPDGLINPGSSGAMARGGPIPVRISHARPCAPHNVLLLGELASEDLNLGGPARSRAFGGPPRNLGERNLDSSQLTKLDDAGTLLRGANCRRKSTCLAT